MGLPHMTTAIGTRAQTGAQGSALHVLHAPPAGAVAAWRRAQFGLCTRPALQQRQQHEAYRLQPLPRQPRATAAAAAQQEPAPPLPAATGRNILIAADTSDDSRHALQWTVQEVWRPGDFIHVTHCIPFLAVPEGMYAVPGNALEDPVAGAAGSWADACARAHGCLPACLPAWPRNTLLPARLRATQMAGWP